MLSDYILLSKARCNQLKTTNITTVLTEMGSIEKQLSGEREKRVGSSHCLTGLATD